MDIKKKLIIILISISLLLLMSISVIMIVLVENSQNFNTPFDINYKAPKVVFKTQSASNALAFKEIEPSIGETIEKPEIYPIISGYHFEGWYTDSALTTPASFPLIITENTSLFPKLMLSNIDSSMFTLQNNVWIMTGSMQNTTEQIIVFPDYLADTDGTLYPVIVEEESNYNATSNFSGNQNIKEVYFGNETLCTIDNMFSDCESLEKVVLGNKMTTIKPFSFMGCRSLTEITIPYSVNRIQIIAFIRSGLTNMYFEDVNSIWESENGETAVSNSEEIASKFVNHKLGDTGYLVKVS